MVESVLIGIESFINKYLKTSPFIIFQCVFCSLCNLIVVGVGVLRREDGGGGGRGGWIFNKTVCRNTKILNLAGVTKWKWVVNFPKVWCCPPDN